MHLVVANTCEELFDVYSMADNTTDVWLGCDYYSNPERIDCLDGKAFWDTRNKSGIGHWRECFYVMVITHVYCKTE